MQCDANNNPQDQIDLGIVNILVGFAPLYPAEFVIISIQQQAGAGLDRGATMAEFTVNATRVDPYKNFKFRVKWDGAYVAGICKVSALKRTTEVVKHRDGGDPSTSRKSPGRTEYEAITLERGVTHDLAFEQWANKVWDYQNAQAQNADQEVSLADFRKDVIIDFFNEAGQKVISYHVYRCWVSEYQALPDLDANANAVAIQHIKLENEGWDRDPAVVEPTGAVLPRLTGQAERRPADGPDRRGPAASVGVRSRRGSARPRAIAAALAGRRRGRACRLDELTRGPVRRAAVRAAPGDVRRDARGRWPPARPARPRSS